MLEEFALDETVVLGRSADGLLSKSAVVLPKSIKLKAYRQNFRIRFSEGLLARRILVGEGATEASAFPVVCRRLAELKSDTYSSLEALGICTIERRQSEQHSRHGQALSGDRQARFRHLR